MEFAKAPNRRELGDESYGTPQRSILGQRNSEVNYYEQRNSMGRFPDYQRPLPKQLPSPPTIQKEVDYTCLPVP